MRENLTRTRGEVSKQQQHYLETVMELSARRALARVMYIPEFAKV